MKRGHQGSNERRKAGTIPDPERLSISEATQCLNDGTVSIQELVGASLRRIADREDAVRAWASVHRSEREYDLEIDRRLPLAGIPIGIKDIYDTVDFPTAYGSPIFAGHQPIEDSIAVKRLREAGAVILGKTATTEFAYFRPAETRNPLCLNRTPGGSSSGSAAAVADFMVPAALGTQTAGSTIRPAAYCGVYGFKPTYGAADLTGVRALAPSLDTAGIFARTVGDLALIAHIISGGTLRKTIRVDDAGPRLVFFKGPYWESLSEGTKQQLSRLDGQFSLRSLRSFSGQFAELTAAQKAVMAREAATCFAELLSEQRRGLSEAFVALCDEGLKVTDTEYRQAFALKEQALGELLGSMEPDEILMTAAAPSEAPEWQGGTGDPICNRLWTFLGLPCVSVPIKRAGKLPLGLQLVGAPGKDTVVLAAAEWISRELSVQN